MNFFSFFRHTSGWNNFFQILGAIIFFAIICAALSYRVSVKQQIVALQLEKPKLQAQIYRMKKECEQKRAQVDELQQAEVLRRRASVVYKMNYPLEEQKIKATEKDVADKPRIKK